MGLKSFFSIPFAKYIVWKNNRWKYNALFYQKRIFHSLIKTAKKTRFGKDHSFSKIKSYNDWKTNIPIRDYEGLQEYISLVKKGVRDVLWPGKPIYFCKTSGTTSGTKYIPITDDSMPHHIVAARDAILTYLAESKKYALVNKKMIFIQGSPVLTNTNGILTGRLSGIVAHHVPSYLTKNRLPKLKTNSIDDWEKKINSIVNETCTEDLSLIAGIPPWVQMYFEKLKEKTGSLIKDIFPNFELFIYGGVNYKPYKNIIEKLIGKKVDGVELYPASEGFIAYQDSQSEKGLLLCVNHGIFYEFVEADDFKNGSLERVSLSGVKIGVNYVIILSTNAGLWGYNIGDTVKFISLNPYKIIVTGRIKHFTSAFGEHVIAEEVESAINECVLEVPANIVEFHVAPLVDTKNELPYHEWFIEFEKAPDDVLLFSKILDQKLQNHNPYYKDLIQGGVLQFLKITLIRKNGFRLYMDSIGKLGGQNKVPRLANNRVIADKLSKFVK
tara:strand:+ start:794 stop:2287 length:1494 start_codon:yes stop_codon:yes gene_type:complete